MRSDRVTHRRRAFRRCSRWLVARGRSRAGHRGRVLGTPRRSTSAPRRDPAAPRSASASRRPQPSRARLERRAGRLIVDVPDADLRGAPTAIVRRDGRRGRRLEPRPSKAPEDDAALLITLTRGREVLGRGRGQPAGDHAGARASRACSTQPRAALELRAGAAPRTPTGRVLRRALRARQADDKVSIELPAPPELRQSRAPRTNALAARDRERPASRRSSRARSTWRRSADRSAPSRATRARTRPSARS